MPPEMALTNASAVDTSPYRRGVRNQPAQHPRLLGERPRHHEGHDRHRQPAHDQPGLHRPGAQVAAADRHPEQQVGQPRQARVVAGEQQLGEQVAGVRQLVERRAGPGARRQVRPHQVRDHRRDHHPRRRPREQGARPQPQERQPQQEQQPVVGQDDREPGLELAQRQAEQRDQQRADRQAGPATCAGASAPGSPRPAPRTAPTPGRRPPSWSASACRPASARRARARRPCPAAPGSVRRRDRRASDSGWVRTRPSGPRRRCGPPRPWPARTP